MAERITKNSWFEEPSEERRPICAEDQEELEKFHSADQEPIKASETFKENLREKLWKFLKGKYYIIFAFTVLFFG